jgi:hypothetical protein
MFEELEIEIKYRIEILEELKDSYYEQGASAIQHNNIKIQTYRSVLKFMDELREKKRGLLE